jgi:hypothetical protein
MRRQSLRRMVQARFRFDAMRDGARCAEVRGCSCQRRAGSGPTDPSLEVAQQAAPPSLARAQNVVSETSQWPLTSVAYPDTFARRLEPVFAESRL